MCFLFFNVENVPKNNPEKCQHRQKISIKPALDVYSSLVKWKQYGKAAFCRLLIQSWYGCKYWWPGKVTCILYVVDKCFDFQKCLSF